MRLLPTLAALLFAAMAACAADASGTWAMSLEAPQGSTEATLILKQDGENVTGTYKGPRNEAPAKGTLKGTELSLTVSIVAAGGQSLTLVITAKVADDKMDGSLNFAGQTVPFKATKKP
jgi:hypothetical protein